MYSHLGRITLRRAVSYVKKKEETQVVGGGVLSIVAAHSLPPSSHNTILAYCHIKKYKVSLQKQTGFFVHFVHYLILFSYLKISNASPCNLQIVVYDISILSAICSRVNPFMYLSVSNVINF